MPSRCYRKATVGVNLCKHVRLTLFEILSNQLHQALNAEADSPSSPRPCRFRNTCVAFILCTSDYTRMAEHQASQRKRIKSGLFTCYLDAFPSVIDCIVLSSMGIRR